jgi:transcriptional regulator with XRE-family HTH domain
MILLRRLLGDVLRRQRQRQGRTLREVSSAARVSLGYLSEVERGQKEASSELLAAICEALDVRMSIVLREVSDELALAELAHSEGLTSRPVLEPVSSSAERVPGPGAPGPVKSSTPVDVVVAA